MSSEYHHVCYCTVTAFSCSLYAMYKMVGCVQNELNSMRDGLHDTIPLELLSGLAAEVHIYHKPRVIMNSGYI